MLVMGEILLFLFLGIGIIKSTSENGTGSIEDENLLVRVYQYKIYRMIFTMPVSEDYEVCKDFTIDNEKSTYFILRKIIVSIFKEEIEKVKYVQIWESDYKIIKNNKNEQKKNGQNKNNINGQNKKKRQNKNNNNNNGQNKNKKKRQNKNNNNNNGQNKNNKNEQNKNNKNEQNINKNNGQNINKKNGQNKNKKNGQNRNKKNGQNKNKKNGQNRNKKNGQKNGKINQGEDNNRIVLDFEKKTESIKMIIESTMIAFSKECYDESSEDFKKSISLEKLTDDLLTELKKKLEENEKVLLNEIYEMVERYLTYIQVLKVKKVKKAKVEQHFRENKYVFTLPGISDFFFSATYDHFFKHFKDIKPQAINRVYIKRFKEIFIYVKTLPLENQENFFETNTVSNNINYAIKIIIREVILRIIEDIESLKILIKKHKKQKEIKGFLKQKQEIICKCFNENSNDYPVHREKTDAVKNKIEDMIVYMKENEVDVSAMVGFKNKEKKETSDLNDDLECIQKKLQFLKEFYDKGLKLCVDLASDYVNIKTFFNIYRLDEPEKILNLKYPTFDMLTESDLLNFPKNYLNLCHNRSIIDIFYNFCNEDMDIAVQNFYLAKNGDIKIDLQQINTIIYDYILRLKGTIAQLTINEKINIEASENDSENTDTEMSPGSTTSQAQTNVHDAQELDENLNDEEGGERSETPQIRLSNENELEKTNLVENKIKNSAPVTGYNSITVNNHAKDPKQKTGQKSDNPDDNHENSGSPTTSQQLRPGTEKKVDRPTNNNSLKDIRDQAQSAINSIERREIIRRNRYLKGKNVNLEER